MRAAANKMSMSKFLAPARCTRCSSTPPGCFHARFRDPWPANGRQVRDSVECSLHGPSLHMMSENLRSHRTPRASPAASFRIRPAINTSYDYVDSRAVQCPLCRYSRRLVLAPQMERNCRNSNPQKSPHFRAIADSTTVQYQCKNIFNRKIQTL